MKLFNLAAMSLTIAFTARADEGMWLFNQPPRQILRDRYQFDATDAWLEHLQKSSIRFNSGGSGSFVSADGLLISNHHVGADALQKFSSEQHNYLKTGFYAKTLAEEIKCLDLELNVLESIEDVTARVNQAVPAGADAAMAFAARRKVIAEIEKESLDRTGLRSDVVTLWEGGAYQLYRYKRYTDVRLVFAPEQQIAFYGGDPDNFEFPRYDLDICIFRAYEDGKPAHVKDYLRFSPTGAKDGELVFVSGNPGGTSRQLTMAELKYLRDHAMPRSLATLKRKEVLLGNWSNRTEENARRARELFFGVQNSRKAYDGELAGLLDPDLMGPKVQAETDFRARLSGPAAGTEYASAAEAYDKIAQATKRAVRAGDPFLPAGIRAGVQLRQLRHRPRPVARRGRTAQAQRRPAAGVLGFREGFPRTGAVFGKADLPGLRDTQSGRFADVFRDATGRGRSARPASAGRQISPRTRL